MSDIHKKNDCKIILIALTAVMFLFAFCLCMSKKPDGSKWLCVAENSLENADGESVQLRGLSTHGINWYPEYINKEAFLTIKESGGNTVRLAMYTDAEGGYLYNPEENIRCIESGISIASELSMYVIVDWHILDDGNPTLHTDEAKDFFNRIAKEQRDNPFVIYEICNEPNHVSWDDIKAYAEEIIPVIRKYSPDSVIIVGTPDYSFDLIHPLADPLEDGNLLYAYHYYSGEKRGFEDLKNAVDSGLPVIVSEWGIGKDSDGVLALEDGDAFAEYINRNNISWCAWSLCNKDESYSVLKPECTSLGPFDQSDLSKSGEVIVKALKGLNEE